MNPRTIRIALSRRVVVSRRTALSRRVAVCRSRAAFASDRERERVISLATTALVMLAGAGTFGMSTLLAS